MLDALRQQVLQANLQVIRDGLVVGTFGNVSSGHHWFDFIVFGLAQGSIYALIALGYNMVYGTLRKINFAHSEVFMGGAFLGYYALTAADRTGLLDANPWVSILITLGVAMLTSVTIAILLERIAYRPLRGAPRLVPLITAIGASFFLHYMFRGLFGTQNRAYPDIDVLKGTWTLFGIITIQKIQVVAILAAALMMTLLYMFIQRTRTGKAMRAVSEDKAVAALMGIDVDAMIVRTFILGAAAAGMAGVLYCFMFRVVAFYMGFIPTGRNRGPGQKEDTMTRKTPLRAALAAAVGATLLS